ncbi:MAG TPA: uracil-DNA glycosylase [Anaerolineaceae bacterium]
MNNWDEIDSQVAGCRKCPRLVAWREQIAKEKRRAYREWTYWGKGVPGFGDRQARILVIGLAPGAHGSNRTGRMFTGDASGEFLYASLFRSGFANQPVAIHRQDGLVLRDVYLSAACRCVPPDNKPEKGEIENCRCYLLAEIRLLSPVEGVVALGKIAFDQALSIYQKNPEIFGASASELVSQLAPVFAHGAFYRLGDRLPWLLASYHPSRQNTQTGRLTIPMFDAIWQQCRALLSEGH